MPSANTDLGLGTGRTDAASPATTLRPVSTVASAVGGPLRRLVRGGLRAVRGAAFWAAVALPFACAVPLFGGPLSAADLGTFAGLAGANLLALVVGHGHRQEADERAAPAGTADGAPIADGGVEVTGEPGNPDVPARA